MKETRVAMMVGLIALTLLILPGITPTGVGMPDPAWARTYGGTGDDLALSVQQTSDGGFIIAGGTKSFGSGEEDIWVLRLDSSGNVVWQKSYGPGEGRSVKQTSEGGFIVAGFTGTFTPVADAFVFKLDPSGGVVWSMTYGGGDFDAAFSVQQTSDGGYLVGGSTRSFAVGIEDAWILRLDSAGNVVWTKTYGGGACNIAYSAQQTSDGGFMFAGRRDSGGCVHEGPDAWVVRLNADGTIAWEETFGAPGVSDHGFSAQQTSDGGFIVAGETEAFGGSYASDFWVLRLDGSGGVVWQKTYGGTGHDLAFSVQQTSDGGFIVAGATPSFGAGNYDFWVLRLDASGGVVWEKTYGGSGDDEAFSVKQTSDGGFIVAGFTGSFGAGGLDASVLRLDAQGEISSECGLTGSSSATVTSTTFVGTASSPTVTSPSIPVTIISATVTPTSATTQAQCEELGDDVCTPPPSGMVSWWPMDGKDIERNGPDGTPNTGDEIILDIVDGNNGLLQNNAGFGPGIVSQALSLPGTTDHARVDDNTNLNIINDLTIDAWINLDNVDFGGFVDEFGVGGDRVIIDKVTDDLSLITYAFGIEGDQARGIPGIGPGSAPLTFIVRSPDGTSQVDSTVLTWTVNTWYHVSLVKSGSSVTFYRNGPAVGTSTLEVSAVATLGARVAIGGSPHPASAATNFLAGVFHPIRGQVDEMEIFNRALSDSEIDAIFDAGSAGKCKLIEVEIDIKPGSFPNSINPRSSGTIPVAILSGPTLDAPSQVDTSSLTFGRTGDEPSLSFCSPSPEDVNGDGLLDLICHFTTTKTGFQSGDTQGVLRAQLIDGTPIEGRDSVRIVTGGGGRASSV